MATKYRVVCTGFLYGQTVQNVLHFLDQQDGLTPEFIAGDVEANYINQVRKRQASDLLWTNILVQNLDTPLVAPFSKIINLPGLSFSSKSIPSFATYVIKLSTFTGGRKGRGRIFVPAVNFNAMEEDKMTQAEITAWESNVFPTFRSAYVANASNALQLMVRHKDGSMSAVQTAQLRTVVGCQRRRNVGVGR